MVHLFNRKELRITWDLKVLSRIRDILASNGIEYSVKTSNLARTSPFDPTSRARIGSVGLRTDAMYQYQTYVKKPDYEKARRLIET